MSVSPSLGACGREPTSVIPDIGNRESSVFIFEVVFLFYPSPHRGRGYGEGVVEPRALLGRKRLFICPQMYDKYSPLEASDHIRMLV